MSQHQIQRLIYWRTPWKTALVLALLLFLEIGLLFRSIISVFAWSGLMVMAYFAAWRLYAHFVLGKRTGSQHHQKEHASGDEEEDKLVEDVENTSFTGPSEENLREILSRINGAILTLRDMFLLTNYLESIKLALFLYLMTYVGAHFNFLTLLILGTVVTFTVPKIYETFQPQIDNVLKLGKDKVCQVMQRLQQKMAQIPALQALLPSPGTQSPSSDSSRPGNRAAHHEHKDNGEYKYY